MSALLPIFANWKTSLAGLGTFLIPFINHVMPVLPPQYAAMASGFVAMLGLFMAQDGK